MAIFVRLENGLKCYPTQGMMQRTDNAMAKSKGQRCGSTLRVTAREIIPLSEGRWLAQK